MDSLTRAQRLDVAHWAAKQVVQFALTGVALFQPAGSWRWPAGQLVWWLAGAALAAQGLVLWRHHPSLLAERARPRRGTAPWDPPLTLTIVYLLPFLAFFLSGREWRHSGGAGALHTGNLVGAAVAIVGTAITAWAMAENAFFSMTVRLQPERGQAVASSGPYRIERHPGYVGMILSAVGMALALGTRWAWLLFGLAALLLVARTALEDRFLLSGLHGYVDYARRVRWRLLPAVW